MSSNWKEKIGAYVRDRYSHLKLPPNYFPGYATDNIAIVIIVILNCVAFVWLSIILMFDKNQIKTVNISVTYLNYLFK